MNQEELKRVVVWQYTLVCLISLLIGVFAGWLAGLSALAGGFCVCVPNSLLALKLLLALKARRTLRPMAVIVGELLKMLAICTLFVLVAKFFDGLNWPAMLAGIIAAVAGQFALIITKH